MSSSHSMQQEWIISWSDCDIWWKVDFLWQQAMTSSLVGLIRNSKALPKATYTPKKMSWSLFGGLLSVWSTSVFWILEKPLHLRSMLCRLMRCTKNCNACSQHRSTERTELQRLTACPTSNASKAQWDEWGLASSTVLTWPLVNWLPLLQASQLFARKMLPQTAWGRKCFHNQHGAENAFQCFIESWGTDFYATGINKFIFHWQKCVDCNGSYLITKDVFKPSYDLKFIIQNHNYICTNLIAVCLRSVPWSFWTCLAMQLCVIEAMVLNGLTVFGIEQELHKSY